MEAEVWRRLAMCLVERDAIGGSIAVVTRSYLSERESDVSLSRQSTYLKLLATVSRRNFESLLRFLKLLTWSTPPGPHGGEDARN